MNKSFDDEVLGLMYISESFAEPSIKDIVATSTPDIFFITFHTNLQDFYVMNRNGRCYDGDNIWSCIQTEKIQSMLACNGWFGEFDHPAPEKEGEKLSALRMQNVPPKYRAFKIMRPFIKNNILEADIQSAQGDVGIGFGKEVLAGWIPQFSCRAIATMVQRNGKPYVIVKKLITYDAPWYPSHKIAHGTSAPSVTKKTFGNVTIESALDVDNSVKNIVVPLKEIVTDIANSDDKVKYIMESFELDITEVTGFTEDRSRMIIKDNNNIIYPNISPESVKKLNDFYASF